MKLHLVDLDAELVDAWGAELGGSSDVEIINGDLLRLAHGAVVSPSNCLGIMDGGIDRDYLAFFGSGIQRAVFEVISARPEGLLPVGASAVVETGHARIKYLVLAPTMLEPEPVLDSSVCYRATRAALRAAWRNRSRISDLFCPGMCTGIGMLEPARAAREMARAYSDFRVDAGEMRGDAKTP